MKLMTPGPDSLSDEHDSGMRGFFSFAALVLIPVGLMVLVMAVKYPGLQLPEAWDHAQVARNIAAGKGWVTDVVRPLSLAVAARFPNQPDLYNAPLHSLSLALPFRYIEASDRVVALTGLGIWVLTVWLTFLIAYRWFGSAVATLATFFYLCTVSSIAVAVAGLSLPLATLFVLAACWAAIPNYQLHEAKSGPTMEYVRLPGWRLLLAGAACALATLTEFAFGAIVIVVGWYVVVTQRNRWRGLALVLAGWLLLLIPWWLRNLHNSHYTSCGLQWYDLLANTRTYPGDSIWQLSAPPADPVFQALSHPADMLSKFFVGGTRLIHGTPSVFHPVIALLALAAIPGLMRNLRLRGLVLLILGSLGLSAAAVCLLHPDPQLLVVWTPLLAILAAVRLQSWMTERIGPFSWHWLWLQPAPPRPKDAHGQNEFALIFTSRQVVRLAVYLLLIAVVVPPLGEYLLRSHATAEANHKKQFAGLQSQVPTHGVVWTDQPAFVAWYAERPAVWLPKHEAELDRVVAEVGPPAAIYVTPAMNRLADPIVGDWWSWVSSPNGIYRGLVPVASLPGEAVLRVQPTEPAATRSAELDRLITETANNTNSSDAHARLAAEYLRVNRLREAVSEFHIASQLDPQNTQALLGTWQTLSRLSDRAGIFGLADRVAELNPLTPGVGPALEEAARFFERAAVLNRDPWLLLNAALCHAKLKHWDQAENCCRHVAAVAPTELPLRLLLGDLYLQKGLPEQALTEFSQLVEDQPANAMAREALGLALREAGQLPEALEAFDKAAKLRTDWPLPYFMGGNTCLQLKRYESAVTHFETAVKLAPHTTRFQFALGLAYTLLNDQDRAAKIYEEILAEYPDDPVALNNLAVAYAKSGQKLDRALALIRQVATAFPNNLEIQDSLGLVCSLAGRPAEAIPILQQVSRQSPDRGSSHYYLAKSLLAVGRRAEALTELRAALATDLPATEKADATGLLQTP